MTSPKSIFQRSLRVGWMIIRLSILLILAFWLLQWENRIHIQAFGWDLDLTAGAGVIAMLLMLAVTWLVFGILRGLFSIHRFWRHTWHRHHIKRAGESFDFGVNAFFMEEYRDALHHFSSAAHHNPPRYDLYCAFMGICAWKSRQNDIAQRYFQHLLRTDRFAFIGYYGLYHLSDESTSPIPLLEEGRHKTKENPWILSKLLKAYEDDGSPHTLEKAKALVLTLYDKKIINKQERRQKTALLLWRQAEEALHHQDEERAQRLAKQSYEQDELCSPAVIYLSKTETPKHAQKMLLKVFLHDPCQSISEALFNCTEKNTESFHTFERTLNASHHPEYALFLGKVAVSSKLWGRAKQSLNCVPIEKRDARFFDIERTIES